MYYYFLQDNNIIYSVDMLRLKTFITFEDFTKIKFRFDTTFKKYVKGFYTSSRIASFFYNYHIVIEDNISFWFGFLHNTEKRLQNTKAKYNLTLEFNPNKLKDNKIILFLLSFSYDWFLVSFDFAFDLKININDIVYNKDRKRHIEIYTNSFNDKTIRIGKNDGKIKIYNKKIESSLNIPYELTRIEVSCLGNDYDLKRINTFDFNCKYIPNIYINKHIYSLSDYEDKTLFAVLFAIQNGFPLEYLTRTYKNKIKKLLTGDFQVVFNARLCSEVVRSTILLYLGDNPFML